MRLALAEAQKAKRISPPNPSVGAVIVRDGRLLGAGFTQQTGGPHAEVMAMRDVEARGETVEGATVYVTLEPCSHYGRTPPCALALIEHRAARVVVATGDPNPKVPDAVYACSKKRALRLRSASCPTKPTRRTSAS